MAGKGGGGEWESSSEEESGSDDDSKKIKKSKVDEEGASLRRLQSLLFGAEKAVALLLLDKGGGGRDFNSASVAAAYILSLRLLGFLHSSSLSQQQQHSESESESESEEESLFFVRSILLRLSSTSTFFNHAKLHLLSSSDRQAFEQAGKDPGRIFRNNGEMDIEKKIKHSNYFQLLLSHRSKTPEDCQPLDQVNRQEERQEDKPTCKTSKNLVQAKLTSLYGKNNNNNIRPNNSSPNLINVTSKGNDISEDCTIIEKSLSSYKFPKRQGAPAFPRVEDDERGYYGNNGFGTKRLHSETRSPENMFIKSPTSTTKEANNDVSRNFVTARAKLEMDVRQKRGLMGSPSASMSPQSDNNKIQRGYSYGFSRRGVRGNFVPPIKSNGGNLGNITSRITGKGEGAHDDSTKRCLELLCGPDGELPEKLRNLEPRLIEHVSNEIMDRDPYVRWDDIAGLNHAKKCITEMVIWPLMRPDIFKGCRSPGRGLLLFGPPGTGKTMIGKAIAGEAKATFFYISASSLTSKWIGEGEKLVRALFGVASCRQPAVIFVDEIDSLLSQRKSEGEHESSRRLKTQFLIEMEGFDSGSEQVLLVGATNRPQELDEAARRRLTKRLYIPLPSSEARAWIIQNLLKKDGLFELSSNDTDTICRLTDGYSGSDMNNLVKDASMGPLREAMRQGIDISELKKEDMRPVTLQDFEDSLQQVRPSVSLSELGTYEEWNKQFGSLSL